MRPPLVEGSRQCDSLSRIAATLVAVFLLMVGGPASAQVASCDGGLTEAEVVRALHRIESTIDPCGETGMVRQVLQTIRQCKSSTYRVCTSHVVERNTFDPPDPESGMSFGTITWNPDLDTELEADCQGDAHRPVLRDPTASLLHELVHAAQDCQALNASELELEAVRVENIYRRAAGLCQRTRYGDQRLPRSFLVSCRPGHCSCRKSRDQVPVQSARRPASQPVETRLGDLQASAAAR